MNGTSKRDIFWAAIIIFILICGVMLSLKLYFLDVELWSGSREVPSFCNISEFINCDAAAMSDYSKFLGIPNSILGLVFYSMFSLVTLLAIFRRDFSRFAMRWVLLFGILSSIVGLYLGYVSFFVLRSFCILCCLTYLINVGVFIFSLIYLKENPLISIKSVFVETFSNFKAVFKKEGRKRGLAFIGTFSVILLIAALAIALAKRNYEKSSKSVFYDSEKVINGYKSYPLTDVQITGVTQSWGTKGAKVKIVEFSDFKCPFCRRAAFVLKTLLKQYEKDVELIFVNYPMESSCNRYVGGSLHQRSCLMAKASICADMYGKFWTFHDFLFENSNSVSTCSILSKAQREGINPSEFEECLFSQKAQNVLEAELNEARRVDISVTPTFIINGRIVKGLLPPQVFDTIIKYEIAK